MITMPIRSGSQRVLPGQYLLAFRRDPTGFLQSLAATHGDIAHIRIGGRSLFLFNHPDYIRDVLVTQQRNFVKGRTLEQSKRVLGEGLLTSEGEFHLRQRRLVQPAFHRQRIAAYASTMAEFTDHMRLRWQSGTTVDVAQEMTQLTLAIIGKTMFDLDIETDGAKLGAAAQVLQTKFGSPVLPFSGVLGNLPFSPIHQLDQARDEFDEVIYQMIAERRAGGDRGDVLSMLLSAQDEQSGGFLSDEQVRDTVVTLLLAGHETTANALTWTWYLLSQHPEVEAQLHAELDTVLEGRLPTFEDVARLSYTRMVLSESMRLYPPAWTIGRRAVTDCEIGGCLVPADSIVLVSQFVMHRDPRYYPDPLRFDPQRWTPEAQAQRPKFAYFPFGAGTRICVGEQFAWMEGILLLATIAQQWQMRLAPGQRVAVQPQITLRPKYGMRMTLERRGV